MPRWTPDPTFYPSPTLAAEAPAEELAYVALLAPRRQWHSATASASIDTEPRLAELRHAGRPASTSRRAGTSCTTSAGTRCSSHLCAYAPNPHMERRYLVVPGTHSSRIHIVDTQPDPRDADAGEGDRGRGGDAEDRLRRAAHRALRPRRHLHQCARRAGRQRAGRDLHARPRDVRGEGARGSRSVARSTSRTTSSGTSATRR